MIFRSWAWPAAQLCIDEFDKRMERRDFLKKWMRRMFIPSIRTKGSSRTKTRRIVIIPWWYDVAQPFSSDDSMIDPFEQITGSSVLQQDISDIFRPAVATNITETTIPIFVNDQKFWPLKGRDTAILRSNVTARANQMDAEEKKFAVTSKGTWIQCHSNGYRWRVCDDMEKSPEIGGRA